MKMLGLNFTLEEIQGMIAEIDVDGDGDLDFDGRLKQAEPCKQSLFFLELDLPGLGARLNTTYAVY